MIGRMFLAYEVLLVLVFILASPWFLLVGLMRGKYLPSLGERLGRHAGEPSTSDLWVQAVSVGEVIAARTIVRAIQSARPGLSIVITTTTLTGQAMAKKLFPECRIAWFPFDFTASVKRFLDHYAPRAYVTVETEIWPNVTRICSERGIPVGLVNGRISDRSFTRYRRIRFFLARDAALCSAVLAVLLRAVFTHLRRAAGVRTGRAGSVTALQRFGSAMNLNCRARYLA